MTSTAPVKNSQVCGVDALAMLLHVVAVKREGHIPPHRREELRKLSWLLPRVMHIQVGIFRMCLGGESSRLRSGWLAFKETCRMLWLAAYKGAVYTVLYNTSSASKCRVTFFIAGR